MLLSIILPCYNPKPLWVQRVVDNLMQIEAAIGAPVQCVLVNDGSTQNIEAEVQVLASTLADFKYIHYTTNKGKGYAIRQGLEAATAPHIAYTDIDFPYTPDSLLAVYHALHTHDIAIGIKSADYYTHLPTGRVWASKTLQWMSATLLRIRITDTQCGLKGMSQSAKGVWLRGNIHRYLFDLEAIYHAEKAGLHIATIPATLRPGVQFSKVNPRIVLHELWNFIRIGRG